MNGIYFYFVNKRLSSWPLLGLLKSKLCFKVLIQSDDIRSTWGKPLFENIVGKGEKCWLPAFFSFFHIVFKRPLTWGCRDCVVKRWEKGTSIFFLFPHCFQKTSYMGLSRLCGKEMILSMDQEEKSFKNMVSIGENAGNLKIDALIFNIKWNNER